MRAKSEEGFEAALAAVADAAWRRMRRCADAAKANG